MGTTRLDLTCEALGDGIRAVRAHGTEAINAFSRWSVEILSSDSALDLDAVVGASATLELADELEEQVRTINLVVTGASFEAEGRDGFHYKVTLAPPQWLMAMRAS